MRILVTGINGFIGQNLRSHLEEQEGWEVLPCTRRTKPEELESLVGRADFICHLAGVNRPEDPSEFDEINCGLTETVTSLAQATGRRIPFLLSSSTQAEQDNLYGASKLKAEKIVREYAERTSSPVYIYRLTNVFGKWCRPEYNSVVATFCHHIANGLPIEIHDGRTELSLVYVDDVIASFMEAINGDLPAGSFQDVGPVYRITLDALAESIYKFRDSRETLVIGAVGTGLQRALYATYLSYLDPQAFTYPLNQHVDERGKFVEFLKTNDSGQFSYLTAGPGITRGAHYHHTKSEKFLVVGGTATFRFRHIATGETHEVTVSSAEPVVVETIPGWAHDITNTGDDELIVLLWANEIFDRNNPDTIRAQLDE